MAFVNTTTGTLVVVPASPWFSVSRSLDGGLCSTFNDLAAELPRAVEIVRDAGRTMVMATHEP